MRKISIVLTTLVLATMLLTACGGEETSTNVPGTNVPPVTSEATSTIASDLSTETVSPADTTTTPSIPVTGEEDPARLSNQLNFDVWNQDGERWIPIPLSFFQWDSINAAFALNVNPAMLRDAPFFQDGQYPDTTAEGWNSEFDTFWQ